MISPHAHIVHYSLPEGHTFGPGGEVLHVESFKLLDFNFLTAVGIGAWMLPFFEYFPFL